jgi:threonine/homoserine/homoserine lactone efflux protein
MTVVPSLIAFVGAAAIVIVTPGMDTALVLRTAAVEGPRRGLQATLGIALGCLVWGASVAFGLGAILTASHTAYTLIKWAGAAYLAYLGLRMLIRPRETLAPKRAGREERNAGGALIALRRGLLSNLLNPKCGVFYVSFLPMFVPSGYAVTPFIFMLALIHVVMGVIWLGFLSAATVPLGRVLAKRGVVRALDRITGAVFLGFGARLVFSERG